MPLAPEIRRGWVSWRHGHQRIWKAGNRSVEGLSSASIVGLATVDGPLNGLPDLRLHHVGHAVPSVAPAAESFRLRFGYTLASRLIHDALQTAHVQFLQLAGERTYLELVAPDSPHSKLVSAVRRGGGLNHLCYSVAALDAAISHLEMQGMKLISDPKPGAAFDGRRICWLLGEDSLPIELVERRSASDACYPGPAV